MIIRKGFLMPRSDSLKKKLTNSEFGILTDLNSDGMQLRKTKYQLQFVWDGYRYASRLSSLSSEYGGDDPTSAG